MIAVGPEVPRAAMLVAAVVEYLLAYDVNADQICILQTTAQEQSGSSLTGECRASIRDQLTIVTHHPNKREELGYLAADEAGEQILFHRRLIEADLVIPILAADLADAATSGTGNGLYPIFADDKAQQRFRHPPALAAKSRKTGTRTQEAVHHPTESPEWLLGVLFGIQVVAGGQDEILELLAGSTADIRRIAAQKQQAAWQINIPAPVDTLIATVAGPQPLSWEEVAQVTARMLPLIKPKRIFVALRRDPIGTAASTATVGRVGLARRSARRDAPRELPRLEHCRHAVRCPRARTLVHAQQSRRTCSGRYWLDAA